MANRLLSKTPKLFKKIRNAGLLLTAISTAIITAPVALPALLITIAGYAAVGGSIASIVAQLTKETE